jgi:starch synthase
MKGAINFSDKVTTVSNTYAREIQTPCYGEKLDGLLKYKSNELLGILNGIDYSTYNPENDDYIYRNYNSHTIESKVENKLKLQEELHLQICSETPVLAIVSRLARQKGINLLIQIIEKLLEKNVQLVVLGTGEKEYEEHFKNLEYRYPNKVSANITFDNGLAHRIYAGADIFLMPSLFEPCGLGQLIALRYGAIPIVRETGGLKDTVLPYNEYTGEGNGFSFAPYNSHDFLYTIERALSFYNDKNIWNGIIKSAMESDNSWEKSAEIYKELYEKL